MVKKLANDTAHLMLKHKWYNLIEAGLKTIEYRKNSKHYQDCVLPDRITKVALHKGYTKTVMVFKIKRKLVKKDIIEIHLGARIQ